MVVTDAADARRRSSQESRERFLAILEPFDEAVLRRQHDVLMSPLLWDLAHVANYEDLWLVRALGGEPTRDDLDDLYDAFKQPRRVREALPLLDLAQARAYGEAVRQQALERLERSDVGPESAEPLLRHGFVHRMVAQHEHQHAETLLAAIQLLPADEGHVLDGACAAHRPGRAARRGARPRRDRSRWARTHPASLDNERPVHVVDLPAFWIDAAPVTNGQYRRFVEAGGYDEPRWWGDRGWALARGGRLVRRSSGDATAPAGRACASAPWSPCRTTSPCSTCAGTRPTPTRAGPVAGSPPRPSGRRQRGSIRPPGPADAGRGATTTPPTSTPTSASATSAPRPSAPTRLVSAPSVATRWWATCGSGLPVTSLAYPGFEWFPYAEYSDVFYGGDYKVLRGSSWATHATVGRTTFRNWDHPIRRQIFAGFRTARDA